MFWFQMSRAEPFTGTTLAPPNCALTHQLSAYAHAKRRGLHSATVVNSCCLELSMQASAFKIVQQMLLLRWPGMMLT